MAKVVEAAKFDDLGGDGKTYWRLLLACGCSLKVRALGPRFSRAPTHHRCVAACRPGAVPEPAPPRRPDPPPVPIRRARRRGA